MSLMQLGPLWKSSMVPRDICFCMSRRELWFPRQALVWQLLAGRKRALLGLVGVMLAITTKRVWRLYA